MSFESDDDREILAAIRGGVARMVQKPLAAQARMREVVGVGRSDDGLVTAKADPDGAIFSLALDPRVMRHDADRLSGDVTAAVKAAQQDSWQQIQQILSGVSLPAVTSQSLGESLAHDGDGPTVNAILRRVQDMYSSVDGVDREERGMHDFIEKEYDALEGAVGTGASASERVTATTDAQGRVTEITVEPRAMRLESHVLADEVLAAVRGARRDALSKVEEKVFDAFPDLDPAADTDLPFQDSTREKRR
ncbi:YbaB/EbfC family nucleoid-associated protein [Nonomuraea antimicrobica]